MRFPSRPYEAPPLWERPWTPPSTKMSGMRDFVLPNTITILWYQRQTVPPSFPLDYMKPPPLGAPMGASFGGGLPDWPFRHKGNPVHLMTPSNIGPPFVPANVLQRLNYLPVVAGCSFRAGEKRQRQLSGSDTTLFIKKLSFFSTPEFVQ